MFRVVTVSLSLVFWGTVAVAHEGADHQTADFSFDPADQIVSADVVAPANAYDGDLVAYRDQLWMTWLEYVPGKGDSIWLGVWHENEWQWKRKIFDQQGEFAAPTLTVDDQQRLWLSYEARLVDQWDVLLVQIDPAGRLLGATINMSCGDGSDIHHRSSAHGDGLWVVWQSDQAGQFDILGRAASDGVIGDVQRIANSVWGEWHPVVVTDSSDRLVVAWDAYDGDSFNVYLREFDGQTWLPTKDVARTPAFEGRPDLAADREGGVWLAWEEGGHNWGKPYRGIRTEAIRDDVGPLHRYRALRLAYLDVAGEVSRLKNPLPMPSMTTGRQRPELSPGVSRLGVFYERPRLCLDGRGRPWVFYRHFFTPWLGSTHRSHIQDDWGLYGRCYGAQGWSSLYRASIGQGDGMQRLELTPQASGVQVCYTTGRTHRTSVNRPRGLVHATFRDDQPAVQSVPKTTDPILAAGARVVDSSPPRVRVRVGNTDYNAYFGDLHRHTDLSLCRVPIDGTIDDAYRYAIEVAQLDFLGITDHSRDLAQGDPLSQLWWRSRKEVYRHQLGLANSRSFIPFYAYERSHGNTADHNVISLRGDLLRPHTYPIPEFWRELDHDTLTIPHQPIRRDTWKYQDDGLRPLVEIFQGCRDASIEDDVHEGLSLGYHLGFIASSDHMSTSASYAGVWSAEASRESLFRSLQNRRTFAATDKIAVAVYFSDQWMGEICTAKSPCTLHLKVQGTAPVRIVQLVVDGSVEKTFEPGVANVELKVRLNPGEQRYAYFHVLQQDGNRAWSSPIWFSAALSSSSQP